MTDSAGTLAAWVALTLLANIVNLHNQHSSDANPIHRLQVGGDTLPGDVAVQPEPIHPGTGFIVLFLLTNS